jgi:hypothetical protein
MACLRLRSDMIFAESEHTFLKTSGVTFYLHAGLISTGKQR